jgi:hypothetical protein
MSGWLGYVVFFLVVFVAIAPRQTLGPVFGLFARYMTVGVVALVLLGAGSYALGVAASEREQWAGYGELLLGALCAAWWLYRLFRPAYRDQAPVSDAVADDR